MSDSSYSELFAPLEIAGLTLKNRIVVPPIVQLRTITSPEGIGWYRRLAEGGAGMVIVEATGVPRFGDDLTPQTLTPLVEAIHASGAAAAIQLFPVRFGQNVKIEELSQADIDEIVAQFGRAGEICREAGFDGVEPHGAHNYMLHQFFMPEANPRTDQYAGSLENRCRLAVRVVEALRKAAGSSMRVLYRHTSVAGGATMEDSLALAGKLIDAGVDILDISPARGKVTAEIAQPFKAAFDVPVIAVGGMHDPAAACDAVREGRCDLIALARQLIADAQWPNKVQDGRTDEILECTRCNEGCFGHLKAAEHVVCVNWESDQVAPFVAD